MFSIYSLCPAPWGDHYRFVEAFDTKEDAMAVLLVLEKVNILFNCYRLVEEHPGLTNKRLRVENKRLEHEVEELHSLLSAMEEGR